MRFLTDSGRIGKVTYHAIGDFLAKALAYIQSGKTKEAKSMAKTAFPDMDTSKMGLEELQGAIPPRPRSWRRTPARSAA